MYYVPELEMIPASPHSYFPPRTPATLLSVDDTCVAPGTRSPTVAPVTVPFPVIVTPCQEAFSPAESAPPACDGSKPVVVIPEPEFATNEGSNEDETELIVNAATAKRSSVISVAPSTASDKRGKRISFSSVTRVVTTSVDTVGSKVVALESEELAERRTSLIDCPGRTPLLLVTPAHARPSSLCSVDCHTAQLLPTPRGGTMLLPRSPAPGSTSIAQSPSSSSLPAWFHSATLGFDDRIELVELSMPLWLDRQAGLKAPQHAQDSNAIVPATDVSALPGPTQRFIPGTLVLQKDESVQELQEVVTEDKELCMDPECDVCATLSCREPFFSGVGSCRSGSRLSTTLRRSAAHLIAKLDETGRVPSVASGLSSLPVPVGAPPPRATVLNDDGHEVLWVGRKPSSRSRSAKLARKLSRLGRKLKRLATQDLSKGPIQERHLDSPKGFCIVSSRGPSCESDRVVPILKKSPYLERWDLLDIDGAASSDTLQSMAVGPNASRASMPPAIGKRSTPWDCL